MADGLLIDVGKDEGVPLYREKGETDWTGTKWTCKHAVYTRHLGLWRDVYRCMNPKTYEPYITKECKFSKPNPKCDIWDVRKKQEGNIWGRGEINE